MTLFPTVAPKAKARLAPRDRGDRQIPTGSPRVVASSADRASLASTDAWAALIDAVRRSSAARLTLLSGRPGGDRVSCPWQQITGCGSDCRCGGAATVAVTFLRGHYESLVDAVVHAASPVPRRRT